MTSDAGLPAMVNGRYRVVRLLGQGGMGQVLLVEDLHRKGRRLALKTLLPAAAADALAAGFQEEFAQLAKLEHPNLARAFDFGRIEGGSDHFFTTEYIEGTDLLRAVRDASVDQLVDVASQLLRALDFIHGHGLLHNDLKPANVLVEPEAGGGGELHGAASRIDSALEGRLGRVRLIDFGLISREHTAWDKILGTIRYISPERILRKPADRRSDLYSLGAVLYLLFARRPPFVSRDNREMLRQHVNERPPPIRQFRRGLPRSVEDVVHRLLEKSPDDRFASAREALDVLVGAPSAEGTPESGEVSIETSSSRRWTGDRLTAGALLFRDRELEQLRDLYDEVAAGGVRTHAVVVEGPAGVGKTRLVEELRGHVQVSGGAFMVLDGLAVEGNLAPVADALLSALQTSGAEGVGRLRSELRGADADEQDPTDRLCRMILERSRETPLLLLVDDLERASRTVRQLAVELLLAADSGGRGDASGSRLMIILARRSARGAGDLRIGRLPTIRLDELSEEESREFLARVFSGEPVPREVADRMASVARGNPLLLLELANSLVSRGVITRSGSGWEFPDGLADVSLPDSLDDLLREQVAAVDGAPRRLLEWIAVAVCPVPSPVLARCAGLRPTRLGEPLDILRRRNLVTSRAEADGPEVHQLTSQGIREHILSTLDSVDRQHRHQRLAQHIEELDPEGTERADVLAHHWAQAGNDAGFLRFAPAAAEILRRRGDYATAVEYRERICEAMPKTALAKKLRSLVEISEMHEFLWDLDACEADLRQILDDGAGVLKPTDRGMILRRLAAVELARCRHVDAEACLREAERLLAGAPPLERLTVDGAWTLCDLLAGRARSADERADAVEGRLRPIASTSSPRDRLLAVATASHVASVRHLRGDLEAAVSLLGQSLSHLDGLGRHQAEAATHCAMGGVLLDLGRWDDARSELDASLAIARQIGDRRTRCRARERVGEHCLRLGRLREALQITRVSLRDAEEISSASACANSLRTLGRLHEVADETDAARAAYRRAVALGPDDLDPLGHGLSRHRLAALLLATGEIDASRREIERLQQEVPVRDLPRLEGLVAAWRFRAAWRERGELDRDAAAEARSIFERCGYRGDLVDLTLEQATMEVEAGELHAARDELRRLRDLTSDHEQVDLESEAACVLARVLLAEGDTAGGAKLLSRLSERARDQHRLALGRHCRELLATIGTPDAVAR